MNTMPKTVCIIDDDPIFVFGAKKIMQRTNLCNNFIVYKNGKEAVDNLIPLLESGEKIPDLFFLDLNMPIMDGWQVLDELSKISTKQKIRICIASSSIDSADLKRAKSYRLVSKYLIKPFSVDAIKQLKSDLESNIL